MSLSECIKGLVAEGRLTSAQAEKADRIYARHFGRLKSRMSMMEAAGRASEMALRELEIDTAVRKRQTLLGIAAEEQLWADLSTFDGGSKYMALKGAISRQERAPYQNVSTMAQRREQQAHGRISQFIERHRRTLLGKAGDKAGLSDMVNELHQPGSTGNARAKVFAEAVAAEFERLRLEFNAAGGAIGKLDGYGMPHAHDPLKVRRAGYAQWRAAILPELALDRMVDNATGLPFDADSVEEALQSAFASIRTNGLTGEGGGHGGAGALANRRSDHRFFIFKDGDAWQRYNDAFGKGDAFTAIMGHIRGMAQDIAMMKRFGPNPEARFRSILSRIDHEIAQGDAPAASARDAATGVLQGTDASRRSVDKLWRYVNGEYHIPVLQEEGVLAPVQRAAVQGLAATRDLMAASLLGSAPISAISDINTQLLASKFNGLPQARVLGEMLSQLNPLDETHRQTAIRLGLGMRDAAHAMLGINRYFDDAHGPMVTTVIADDVMRLSGLNKWTEGGQRAHGMVWLGHLADHRHLSIDALPDELRSAFSRHGISSAHWDAMRRAPVHEQDGVAYMAYDLIDDADASDRMMDMVLAETDMAVKMVQPDVKAGLVADRPGTLGGEMSRNFLQFKSFGINLLLTEFRRAAMLGGMAGMKYGARLVIGMTLFGAASIQLREIAKGRDPRPMQDWEFWADALFQGGGLGIAGDLIGSFASDRQASVLSFFGGPGVGMVQQLKDDVIDPMGEDMAGLLTGDPESDGDTMAGILQFGRRYTPGSSLWYLRSAFDHIIMDTIQQDIDPDYFDNWEQVRSRAEEQGRGLYWEPGELAPDRAPDFATAFEEPPQ